MKATPYLMATRGEVNPGGRKPKIAGGRRFVARKRVFVCVLAALLCRVALAQRQWGLDFGGGYSQLSFGDGGGDDVTGWGLGLRGWFPAETDKNGLRAFIGDRWSFYTGDAFKTAIWNAVMMTPEIGLAWHLQGQNPGLFVEPMVAAGLPMASFSERVGANGTFSALWDESKFAIGWGVRPGVLCGYQSGKWGLGAELSYGFMGIHFSDEASGIHEELYVGLFLRIGR